MVLWLVSLFSKCNDQHVAQPGAGLSFTGTVCYLAEMGNLVETGNLQNRRDLLFKFYDTFYDNNFDLVVNMDSAVHSLV